MEQTARSVSDIVVLRTITDWNVSVAAVNRTLRVLLPAYDGYECKEPEPGKFTLTFRYVRDPRQGNNLLNLRAHTHI